MSIGEAQEGKKLSECTIVPSHKGVAVGTPLLPIDPLLCLLERNVHVAVNGLQLACFEYKREISLEFQKRYRV